MKDYLSSGKEWLWMITIVAAAVLLIQVIGILKGNVVYWFSLIFFFTIFVLSRLPDFLSARFLKKIKAEGIYESAEKDFESAVSFEEDRVRLGEKYIFSRGKRRLLKYEDIVQVYCCTHIRSRGEDSNMVMYVDVNGKENVMYNQDYTEDDECMEKQIDTAFQIFGIIQKRNPSVEIKDFKIIFEEDSAD